MPKKLSCRIEVGLSDYRSFLATLEPIPQDLTPELKAEIVKQLVHSIDVSDDGIVIHFYAGSKTISEKSEQYQAFALRAEAEEKKALGVSLSVPKASRLSSQTLLQDGSGTVKNGAARVDRLGVRRSTEEKLGFGALEL